MRIRLDFQLHHYYNSFWKNLKISLFGFFKPQNKWLTDKIPTLFMEYDDVIETACFGALIDFWENDGGKSNWEAAKIEGDTSEGTLELYESLHEAYEWAKIRDREWTVISGIKSFDERQFHEDQLNELDNKTLLTIIKYRKAMWT